MKNLIKNLRISILFCLIVYSFYSKGQGFYIDAGGGYCFSALGSGDFGQNTTSVETTLNGMRTIDKTAEVNYETFGKGISAGVSIGYMLNKNFGAEVGLNYLVGSSLKSHYSETISEINSISIYEQSSLMSAKMMRIIPTLKIQAGEGNLIPYMKLGLVIGLFPTIDITNTVSSSYSNSSGQIVSNRELTEKYTQGSSIGFMCAIGANYKLSEKILIFTEVGMIGQSWGPGHGEITAYTIDGKNELEKMPSNERNTDFFESFTETKTYSINNVTNAPNKQLKPNLPFSSWGINLGVHLKFGG